MSIDRKTAKIAGILYLVIIFGSILGGILTEMYMQSQLVRDAADAAASMIVPDWSYRIGFTIYLLVYLSEAAAAVILYVLLRPVNKDLALLAAVFRFAEAAILGLNMQNHFTAFQLVQGDALTGAYPHDQMQSMASLFLNAHRSGYLISQVFFGLHCFFLGYLIQKSGYFPRIIGTFLIAASFGYLIESFSYFVLPNYESAEAIISWISAVPAVLAEFSLTFWLLFKGADIEKQYQQAQVPG